MKFSYKTVHEKHVFASSACVVERPDSLRDKKKSCWPIKTVFTACVL